MRLLFGALLALSVTGCMGRAGVIDCTTGRAYPGFSKPLCGGPCDPFMWLAGDCSTCCCGSYKCAYTPYGGVTHCGDDMVYGPSCVASPLRWSAPAIPTPPAGHTVYPPGPVATPAAGHGPGTPTNVAVPPSPPSPPPERADSAVKPPSAPPSDEAMEMEPEINAGPAILHDARNERLERSRL